ncbi:hypothetical protein [Neomoorella thermoacetica]|uniref:hypothetical protein n=1 Tax=Neomoorella thermoacetica TaxID=1525 RepID=UPI0008FABC03|nr:hypothetical protein [Moorella thermoacetica]
MLSLPREAGAFATTTPGPYGLSYAYTEGALFQFYFVNPLEVSQFNQNNLPSDTQFVNMPVESRFTWDLLFAPIDWSTGSLNIGKGYGFMHPAAIPQDLSTWLEALEWPVTDGYYNVTDAGAKQGSTAVRNIFYHNVYGTWFRAIPHSTNASPTDPLDMGDSGSGTSWVVKINDGRFDFTPLNYDNSLPEIGGNGQFIYFYSFTKEGAIGFLSRMYQVFSGDNRFLMPDGGCEQKKVAFTIDLAVTQLTAGSPGSNGTAPYAAVIENLSPFEAHNALFELYVWPEGDPAPTRVDSRQVDLPRASVAAGTPGAVTLTGFFAAPVDRSFRLVASINAPYDAGGSVLGANPGKWAKQPYSPVYKGSVPPGIGAFMEPYYDNNVKATNLMSGAEPPDSGGGGGGSEPPEPPPGPAGDLIATSINLYNTNGSLMGDSLMQNTEYTVRANFRSTFDQGGYAQLRLYVLQDGSYQLRDSKYAYFEPGGSLTWESLSNSGSPGSKTYIATVNLWRSDGGSWDPGQFTLSSGSKVSESTYDNNKIEKTYSIASEGPPSTDSNYASYYPLVTKLVPRYRTEKIKVWVPEVKKVPIIFDESNPKIRVRLIPEPGEK